MLGWPNINGHIARNQFIDWLTDIPALVAGSKYKTLCHDVYSH